MELFPGETEDEKPVGWFQYAKDNKEMHELSANNPC